MALGIDLKDPLCPAGNQARVDEWNAFFTTWKQKPEFVGRYFGETDNAFVVATSGPWLNGEIRLDLRAKVSGFSSLLYIVPLAPTGPLNDLARVTITGKQLTDAKGNSLLGPDGKPLYANGREAATNARTFPVFYSQEGKNQDLTPSNDSVVRSNATHKAKKTCEALAALIIRDPFRRQEVEISASGDVFVFLDVEPWTKLSAVYWNTWAKYVRQYTVDFGVGSQTQLAQPFKPCLYCAVTTTGPFLPEIAAIFSAPGSEPCDALATPWNPSGAVYDTVSKAVAASEADVQAKWPFVADLQLKPAPAPVTQVVFWQYKINLASDPTAVLPDVDLGATRNVKYQNRDITDYFLRIVW